MKNANEKLKSCYQNMRCTCLKQNKSCSKLCRCRNCSNGKPETTSAKRRKRQPTFLSSTLSTVSSYEYAIKIGEDMSKSSVTSLQHFFLEGLIFKLTRAMKNPFDTLDKIFAKKILWDEYTKTVKILIAIPNVDHHAFELHKTVFERWLEYRQKKKIVFEAVLPSVDKSAVACSSFNK